MVLQKSSDYNMSYYFKALKPPTQDQKNSDWQHLVSSTVIIEQRRATAPSLLCPDAFRLVVETTFGKRVVGRNNLHAGVLEDKKALVSLALELLREDPRDFPTYSDEPRFVGELLVVALHRHLKNSLPDGDRGDREGAKEKEKEKRGGKDGSRWERLLNADFGDLEQQLQQTKTELWTEPSRRVSALKREVFSGAYVEDTPEGDDDTDGFVLIDKPPESADSKPPALRRQDSRLAAMRLSSSRLSKSLASLVELSDLGWDEAARSNFRIQSSAAAHGDHAARGARLFDALGVSPASTHASYRRIGRRLFGDRVPTAFFAVPDFGGGGDACDASPAAAAAASRATASFRRVLWALAMHNADVDVCAALPDCVRLLFRFADEAGVFALANAMLRASRGAERPFLPLSCRAWALLELALTHLTSRLLPPRVARHAAALDASGVARRWLRRLFRDSLPEPTREAVFEAFVEQRDALLPVKVALAVLARLRLPATGMTEEIAREMAEQEAARCGDASALLREAARFAVQKPVDALEGAEQAQLRRVAEPVVVHALPKAPRGATDVLAGRDALLLQALWTLLPQRLRARRAALAFSAKSDGYALQTARRHAAARAAVVVVLRVAVSGEVVGVFAPEGLRPEPQAALGAFLFALSPEVKKCEWEPEVPGVLVGEREDVLEVGDARALVLDRDLLHGSSGPVRCFRGMEKRGITLEENFEVSAIEIFELVEDDGDEN